MGKTLQTLLGLIISVSLCSNLAQADVINMNIDSSNSQVFVSIDGVGPESSSLSGTLLLDLSSLELANFSTARITDMNAILQDGMVFDMGGGFIISTNPNEIGIDLITAGPGGPIIGGQFDQSGNLLGLSGTANSTLGPFDLGDLEPALVNFFGTQVSKSGNEYTLTAFIEYQQTIPDLNLDIAVVGTVVAHGFAAVPEPGSALACLGLVGTVALQRRRRNSMV